MSRVLNFTTTTTAPSTADASIEEVVEQFIPYDNEGRGTDDGRTSYHGNYRQQYGDEKDNAHRRRSADASDTYYSAPQAAASQQSAPLVLEERVAERILETLHAKDVCIDELQRSVAFLQLEGSRMRAELDDLRVTKDTLLAQYTEAMKDVCDGERKEEARAAAVSQAERYAAALDDANKALTLQLDALSEQTKRADALEEARQSLQATKQSLESSITSLKIKNSSLLEELRSMAERADVAEKRHEDGQREWKETRSELQKKIEALHAQTEDRKALEAQLEHSRASLSTRDKQLKKLVSELKDTRHALETLRDARGEAEHHVSVQRDALDLSEQTLLHAQSLATDVARELEQTQYELQTVVKEREDLQAQLHERDQALSARQRELERCTTLVQTWRQQCEDARADLQRVLQENEQCASTYEASVIVLQQELDVCKQQLVTQNSILARRREVEETLSEERSKLSLNVEDLEETVESGQLALRQWKAKHRLAVQENTVLKDELQRIRVLHADELRELQELSSSVAAGQSRQIEELSRSQETVVKRLIAAEEELGRKCEACDHLEDALRQRSDEIQSLTQRLTVEMRRGQALSSIATEKEHTDMANQQLTQKLQQAESKLNEQRSAMETLQRRHQAALERLKQNEETLAAAKKNEEQLRALSVASEEACARAKTKDKECLAKQEGLRAVLEERSRLIQQLEACKADSDASTIKIKELQRQLDERQRALQLRTDQAAASAGQVEEQKAAHRIALQEITSRLSQTVARVIVTLLRHVFQSWFDVGKVFDAHQQQVDRICRRLIHKYERDVEKLQSALTDVRRRWRGAEDREADWRHQAVSRKQDIQRLQDEARLLRRQLNEKSILGGVVGLAGPTAATTTTTTSAAALSMSTSHLSEDMRLLCHNISQEVLGLPGGLNDLTARVAAQEEASRRRLPNTAEDYDGGDGVIQQRSNVHANGNGNHNPGDDDEEERLSLSPLPQYASSEEDLTDMGEMRRGNHNKRRGSFDDTTLASYYDLASHEGGGGGGHPRGSSNSAMSSNNNTNNDDGSSSGPVVVSSNALVTATLMWMLDMDKLYRLIRPCVLSYLSSSSSTKPSSVDAVGSSSDRLDRAASAPQLLPDDDGDALLRSKILAWFTPHQQRSPAAEAGGAESLPLPPLLTSLHDVFVELCKTTWNRRESHA